MVWKGLVFSRHHGTLSLGLRYLLLSSIISSCNSFLPTSVNTSQLYLDTNNSTDYEDLHQTLYEINDNDVDNTIRTDGCTIPALQPFRETLKSLVRSKQPLPCKDSETALISRNKTHLWIDYLNLVVHDVPFDANLSCCYQGFYRPVQKKISDKDNHATYNKCFWFSDVLEPADQFVRVKCYYNKKFVHQSFHLFAIEDELPSRTPTAPSAYNVIVLGIDNVSRLNFHRTMPRTFSYLRKKGAIELFGYNKVGYNSFPNIIPMLTGLDTNELEKTCHKSQKTFDNCPFVWNSFKNAGFYTALGEDSSFLGTFNYLKKGFKKSPTDYYLRTFMHEAERSVGNNKDYNSFLCMGDKYSYAILLDYIEDLSSTKRSAKLFGFFWEVTMTHDYLNYPNVMDEKYEALLSKLDNSSYLDETIIIVLSDHGIRWDNVQKTKQGRLEERLPMVNILLPPSFRHRYRDAYQNLLLNRRRLTTPFDIHATLADLINLRNINNENMAIRHRENYNSRSISLFLPIPYNRTCQSAHIEPTWCTCQREVRRSKDTPQSHHITRHVINHLNYLIKEQFDCAKLSIHRVKDIRQMSAGEVETKAAYSWLEYRAVIQTTPGNGIFEATLRRKTIKGLPDGDWMVTKINRLNAYINQSQCVQDYKLKQYCYCQN